MCERAVGEEDTSQQMPHHCFVLVLYHTSQAQEDAVELVSGLGLGRGSVGRVEGRGKVG